MIWYLPVLNQKWKVKKKKTANSTSGTAIIDWQETMWRGDNIYMGLGFFFFFFFLGGGGGGGGGGGSQGSEVGCNHYFCIVYFHMIQQF